MRTENDMMPTEVRAQDLTPGDLVNVSDLTGEVDLSGAGGMEVTSVVQGLSRGERVTYVTVAGALVHKVSPDLPVTVQPVICADCGHAPADCECEDVTCPHCGVELDGYEVVELDAKSCFNCSDKED